MPDIKTLLILIPALPLAAAILTAVLGKRVLRGRSHWPAVAALLLSFLASVVLLFQVQKRIDGPAETRGPATVTLWSWYNVSDAMPKPSDAGTPSPGWGDFHIEIALQADPLTAVMLAVVTCISSLVAIYSIGYMHGDAGYWRFFAYVSLFVFSMTLLVSANNFILLYIGWELVGLCSYLLIGFWFREARGSGGGHEGVPGQPRRRRRFRPGDLSDLDDVRHSRLRRRVRRGAGTLAGDWRTSPRFACCC